MTQLTADFALGGNGATIATTDPGSANAWDVVSIASPNTLIYSNTHPAHGALSAKFSNGASGGMTSFLQWSIGSLGTITDHYGRFYLYPTQNPTVVGVSPLQFELAGVFGARLVWFTTGLLRVDTISSQVTSFTNAVATGQLVRIEWHIVHSATVGVFEVKLFNSAESTTPTETITLTNQNTGTGADTVKLGAIGNLGGTVAAEFMSMGNVIVGAPSYPGPVASAPAYISQAPVNDKQDGYLGPAAISMLQQLDLGIVNGGSGYVAVTIRNDKDFGHLGPTAIVRLNAMSAALANAGSHYTALGFVNDRFLGHFGPDLLSKLNAMETQIAALRP